MCGADLYACQAVLSPTLDRKTEFSHTKTIHVFTKIRKKLNNDGHRVPILHTTQPLCPEFYVCCVFLELLFS